MLSTTPARQRSRLSQSRRPSNARSRGTTQTTEAPEMPAYQPPEAPLTVESHRQIHKLCESRNNRLKEHLKSAFEKLTDTACDINERSTDARVRYEKIRRQRREAVANADGNGDGDVSEEEDQNSEEFQQLAEQERKVADVTARLEEKMRQLIDTEARYEILQNSISRIETEEDEVQNAALGARQTRESRRRRRRASHSEDDGEDERDENHEATPEQEMRQRNAQNPPSRRLDDYLTEGTGKWNGLSLTERYAGHNTYIGFYRVVHNSKFPGDDVPPMPHSSKWFSHLEDTSAHTNTSTAGSPGQQNVTRAQREPSPAESDDIAIERERISLKCPLTLLPFREPITSTKCPHSFEREAIYDMIARSDFHFKPPGGRRVQAVKCPVCSIPLTANDLRTDPALVRKVRRAAELSAREAEDQLEEGSQREDGRPDRVQLASDAVDADATMDVDDDEEESDGRSVKSEPVDESDSESEQSEEDEDTEE